MSKLCSVEGCNKPSRSWGMCSTHFQRAYHYGDPSFRHRRAKGESNFHCTIEGCNKEHKAHGFCDLHYQRFKRFGDPLFTKIRPHGDGTIVPDGYKKITVNGQRILEHRHIVEQHIGRKLRKDEVVHHLDGNRLNNELSNLVITHQSHHAKHSPKGIVALTEGRKHRWLK